jgi:hypothetical protein
MNAQEFSNTWGKPLVKFALTSPAAQGISDASREALTRYGLPASAEPWLQFMEILRTDAHTASELDRLHCFPIGWLPNGDIICLEKSTDRLIICDHEDISYTWPLNSSLEALYESVTLYGAFIAEVNQRNPRYASDFKIPEGMLAALAEKLQACDPDAFAQKGFWLTEIRALDDSVI